MFHKYIDLKYNRIEWSNPEFLFVDYVESNICGGYILCNNNYKRDLLFKNDNNNY